MKKEQVINEYREYKGSGRKPADYDAYWDKAIQELAEQSLDYELERVEIPSKTAEFFNLYFTGVKGARIRCQYIRPKKIEGKVPGMLMFHGYHGDSGDFGDKLSWVTEGFAVLAMDCRGQGGES